MDENVDVTRKRSEFPVASSLPIKYSEHKRKNISDDNVRINNINDICAENSQSLMIKRKRSRVDYVKQNLIEEKFRKSLIAKMSEKGVLLTDEKASIPKKQCALPIPYHVVDDHNDALPFWHLAMRRKALPMNKLQMVHFDAHPDLAITKDLSSDIFFKPLDLYNALETSSGGIAEWILPLVFEGHLTEVWWFRPPWAHQFQDGQHDIGVGIIKSTGCVGVHSEAPYYVDDRVCYAEDALKDINLLKLHVLPILPNIEKKISLNEGHWGLDICLDTFCTGNPHLNMLRSLLGDKSSQLVVNVYAKPIFRGIHTTLSHYEQVNCELVFSNAVADLLCLDGKKKCLNEEDTLKSLIELYPEDIGGNLVQEFKNLVDILSVEAREKINMLGLCAATSPCHMSSKEDMISLLEAMKEYLLDLLPLRPALITIARSANDRYTPHDVVDWLEDEVFKMIENTYGHVDQEDECPF